MEVKKGFLTGNQLKIIALIAMTLDHIGKMLLPGFVILQIIGRLAFPIFAYMIAEGCRYTKNRKKYLIIMIVATVISQFFYTIVMKNWAQCILVSFTLAILTIYAFDKYIKDKKVTSLLAFLGIIIVDFIISNIIPMLFPKSGFVIDYGFFGIMLPVFVYIGKNKTEKLIGTAVALAGIALIYGGIQWFSFAALILIALYNGERGVKNLKYLFYIYYPLHIGVIYFVWRYLYLAIRLFNKIF
ncbi:MAG: hypothetical protein IJC74_03675 [Clostridia bacterium]|nr:hypothetical protein [Clostridia bacterium]